MRALRVCLLILVSLTLMPSLVWANDPATISFNCGQPIVTGGTGTISITASGPYTVDCTATVKDITLYAKLSNAGPGGQNPCKVTANCAGGTWNGSVTIPCLSSGSYTVNVYARIHVTVGGVDQYYDTVIYSTTVNVC